jgi:hypothetical protein
MKKPKNGLELSYGEPLPLRRYLRDALAWRFEDRLQSPLGALDVEVFSEVFFAAELSFDFLSDFSDFFSSAADFSLSAFSAAFLPLPA